MMSEPGAPSEPPATEESGALVLTDGRGSLTMNFVSRLARNVSGQVDRDSLAPLPSSNPALCLAVVTCMDTRIDLESRLGIRIGDAHILRNAGGRVTPDVVRSLHLSAKLMKVREIGILHHTDCGLSGTDNDTLARRTGVDSIDFLPFQSPSDSVSADVTAVLQAEILPAGGVVWGAVYRLDADCINVIRGPITVT
jgi:carbonic anhydrase